MTTETTTGGEAPTTAGRVGTTRWRRLIMGQTAIDFWGRRRIWLAISVVLLVITGASLITRGLVLGIDFAGGVAWDVPAGDLTVDEAAAILEDNGLSASSAKIQERRSDSGDLHQDPGRGPADGRAGPAAGGLRRGRRRRPR